MGRRERLIIIRTLVVALLVVIDSLALLGCFGLSFWLRADLFVRHLSLFEPMQHGFDLYLSMWQMGLLWIVMFAYEGLYPSLGLSTWEELKHLLKGNFVAFVLLVIFTFVTRTGFQFSRTVIVLAFMFSLLMLPLSRRLTREVLTRLGLWERSVVLVGEPVSVNQVLDNLRRHPDFGLKPMGVFLSEPGEVGGLPFLGGLADIADQYVRAEEVIVAMPELDKRALVELVELVAQYIAPVVKVLPDLYGLASAGVQTHDLDGMLLLELEDQLALRKNIYLKRCFDTVCASLGLIVLSPFFLITALVIKLSSPGPVFFGHNRIGRDGATFKCYKFRSMVANAQDVLEELLARDPEARAEWQREFKLKNDPRITKVGAFLRKTSLDELPQLFNVVRGEMSLVGPRPIVKDEIELYGAKVRYFFKVTPGITGLWQVSGRNDISYDERVMLDEYYAKNWSLWLDVEILLRTFGVVFKREGAY